MKKTKTFFCLIAILSLLSSMLVAVWHPVMAQEGQPPPVEWPMPDSPSCSMSFNQVATNSCCGYSSPGNPYPCCNNSGNCTWWAWREYQRVNNQTPPCGGNAKDWVNCAQPSGSPPRVGSVVVFQPNVYGADPVYGHVAYVEWVDNPLNPSYFSFSEMGCSLSFGCSVRHRGPKAVISGVNFIYPPGNPDIIKPTNPTSITSLSHYAEQWSGNRIVKITWSGAADTGAWTSGIGGYSWAWTQDPNTVPDMQRDGEENITQTSSPPLATGQSWYFHIRSVDKSNNWADGAAHYGPFWIDASAPQNPTWVQETHGAPNGWQNSINDPAFTWGGASDAGSGVAHYTYYWGEDPNGLPNVQTTATTFDPPAVCAWGSTCTRYLRLQTADAIGLTSAPITLYTFRYDGQLPNGTFTINNGSTTAFQVAVQLQINASDSGSGLEQMRLSNDGINWLYGWQPFSNTTEWFLDAVPSITHTVYLEVRDIAGNITALPSQSIWLDLSGARPRSANYQILTDVQARGGGLRSSALYRLNSTLGQTIAGKGIVSGQYALQSGFQGAWLANPRGVPPIKRYQLLSSVIGGGGGHKVSQNYQINSTNGQSAQTGMRSSNSYQLVSGFWANIAGTGASQPTPSPTPDTTPTPTSIITATPTPMPTVTPPPPPEFYGVSINQAAIFTHDYRVTLFLEALDAVEMMVSNDGGFGNAYWEAYAITKTWEIDFYQDYVLPRTVYVRYRDAEGNIHGNFTDDIVYDPNLPTGSVNIVGMGADEVVLNLNLTDDLSGMGDVLIATAQDLQDAVWQPYAALKMVAAQPGDLIYVYYRDVAGNQSLYPYEIQVPMTGEYKIYLPLLFKD